MKHMIKILIPALAAALLATGCMSELKEPGMEVREGSSKITFTLPASRNVVTYVAAEGDENDMNDLTIYMFNEAKDLERIFRGSEIVVGVNDQSKPTFTIDVTERAGKKTFYFVANHTAITSELGKVRFNHTKQDDFEQIITDVQTKLPVTPLLMSYKQEVADVANIDSSAGELEIEMLRRVARFDIENDSLTTNFVIKNIVVGNVNRQAYLFGDATPIANKVLDAGNMTPIVFDTITGANGADLVKSVFFTYPSTVGDGKTDISFEGVFNGNTRMYSLNPPQGDYEIEANKRYILKPKVVSIDDIVWEITVKEWDEGEEIDAETEKNKMIMSTPKVVQGRGILSADKKTLDLKDAHPTATILEISTTTYRSQGTRIEVEYISGDETIMPIEYNEPDPVLTYGARYEQTYFIQFPRKTLAAAEARVKIINASDPFTREIITVTQGPNYPETNTPPVLVGGIIWAPSNVGATTMNGTATGTDVGLIYQWGRSYIGFPTTGSAPTVGGPFNMDAAKNTHGTKYITRTTHNWNWLTPDNYDLWKGDDRRGPCPEGWRVPTKAELQKVVDAFTAQKATIANNILRVESDVSGQYLYFQHLGYRRYDSGNMDASRSIYWTSTARDAGYVRPSFMELYPNSTIIGEHITTEGGFVRCVLDKTLW